MSLDSLFSCLRGQVTIDAPIGAYSWFRCGGAADYLYEPADSDDLAALLGQLPADVPVTIIGGLANTIVRDNGVRGVVIRLGKSFAGIDIDGDMISAGAGALNGSTASMAAKNGLGGLEFLSGIPGTIGGAVAMNAGAYGSEIKDCLITLYGINRQGQRVDLSPDDLNMTYRRGNIPAGVIITRAVFKGLAEDKDIVKQRLKEIKRKRNETQPIRDNTGGSTFANPSPDLRAWQVVDQVGGRDLQIGGAKMSAKHCNFMVNDGTASSTDLESLGDELIIRAQKQMGISLHWEVKRIGDM